MKRQTAENLNSKLQKAPGHLTMGNLCQPAVVTYRSVGSEEMEEEHEQTVRITYRSVGSEEMEE